MKSNRFSTILILSFFCITVRADRPLTIVENGKPASAVILGKNAAPLEKQAAREFTKYIERMTGARLPIVSEKTDRVKNFIVIGRAETNPLVSDFILQRKIGLNDRIPGRDGFIIKTFSDDGQNFLVLGGSLDRGTLYSVYHLFENYLGVGFFENGDQIPARKTVALETIDYSHRPRFEIRVSQQGCAWHYSYKYWDIEVYKVLIDWMVKKKYNTFWWNEPARIALEKRVMKNLGIKDYVPFQRYVAQSNPDWEQYELKIFREVARYAVSRGLDLVGHLPALELSETFRKKFPDADFLTVEWGNLNFYVLHPKDPLFARIMRDYAREYEKEVGAPIKWWGPCLYPEYTFKGVEEREYAGLFLDFVDGVYAALSSKGGPFGWQMSGWGHLVDPFWTEERAEKFFTKVCEKFAPDQFIIADIDAYLRPIYNRYKGFEGASWGFGVLHCFAGNTQLWGQLTPVKDRIAEALTGKWGGNCRAFYVQPEIIGHNFFFYEAISEMAWDYENFTLDEYVKKFVTNRYGGRHIEPLSQAWRKIIDAYYTESTWIDEPTYQRHLYTDLDALPGSFHKIQKARDAIELLLQCQAGLRDNEFYLLDLVDIVRQYNTNLYNYHFYRYQKALSAADWPAAESELARLKEILNAQIAILKTHPSKYLSAVIQRADRLPDECLDIDNKTAVRQRYTSWMDTKNKTVSLMDYCRADLVELLRDYYLPRLEREAQFYRDRIKDAVFDKPSADDHWPIYEQITKEFISINRQDPVPARPAANLVEIVEENFRKLYVEDSQIQN